MADLVLDGEVAGTGRSWALLSAARPGPSPRYLVVDGSHGNGMRGGTCVLLEAGDLTVEEIARRSGLGSAANLRLQFRRTYGNTPLAYRSAFRSISKVST